MLCILYVTAVGALLGIAGLFTERALPATFPRRLVWCLIIPTSVFLPGYNRMHHNFSVTDLLSGRTGAGSSHAMSSASPGILDPDWWVRAQSFDSIINQTWLVASVVLILWAMANVARVWLVVWKSRKENESPRVVDGVPIVVTDAVGPATVGLLRSSVLVPRWVLALPGIQRRYVLCHEEQHRKAHDSLLLFVMSCFLVLMPWNIALWWHLRRLRLAVEMDCDNRVVMTLGNANAYGELLLKVAQAGSRGPRFQPALLGVGMLEKRLTALLAPTPLRHVQRFLLPAVAVILLVAVVLVPHPVTGHGGHARVAVSADKATSSNTMTKR